MKLEKQLYWGGSVSSFQTEGAWNEDGKGLSIYDVRPTDPTHSDWKVAIDAYHRYSDDIKLLKEMNFNFYRFSISWARLIPTGELDAPVNQKGVDFYNKLIDELIENGITPMITLVHFDMPYELVEKYNGFASRHVVDCFERYAKVAMKLFGDRVKHWMTFNEQNLHTLDLRYSNAEKVPEGTTYEKHLYQVAHNVMVSHCRAVRALREIAPDAKICGMSTITNVYPKDTDPRTSLYCQRAYDLVNNWVNDVFTFGEYPSYYSTYLKNHGWFPTFYDDDEEVLKYTVDYLAFSYYRSNVLRYGDLDQDKDFGTVVGETLENNPAVDHTAWMWDIDPYGMRWIMNDLYRRYRMPVFILENGVAHNDIADVNGYVEDDYRIDYHRDHIREMKKAILEDGVECLGYITWGPIDIPSSSCQIAKRYGFVYVNRTEHDLKDLKRTPKKSFAFIKETFGCNADNIE